MEHIVGTSDGLFVIKAFAMCLSLVVIYVLVVNAIVLLVVRKKNDERISLLRKRALVKTPFVITGYWFLVGLGCYIGVALINRLFGGNTHANAPAGSAQLTGPEIVLVGLTLVGFCIGVGIGLAAFFKGYKAVNSSISNDAGK